MQRWILDHVLDALALAEPAHGFRTGRSIVSNAIPHVGAAVVVNVDLTDFFPTVTYRRVKGLFGKLGYSEEVATVLGLLCTEPEIAETAARRHHVLRRARRRAACPQGAPTSPAITNVAVPPPRSPHRRLGGASHGFAYTRYADDLTLSTRAAGAPVGSMLAFLRKVVAAEGFDVHPDKMRVVRRGRRQEVTGVVVNERPGVPRDELRKFRALLHHIEKDGPAGKTWGAGGGDVLASALGFASFVAMVDPAKGEALRARVLALRAKWPSS